MKTETAAELLGNSAADFSQMVQIVECNVMPDNHADLASITALQPLLERDQWAIWRWVETDNGRRTKPPFVAAEPQRHASISDPNTWRSYAAALTAAQAGAGDGACFMLTENDELAAIDLDDCRDPDTGSITAWAQLFLQRAAGAYVEITPSGAGLRVWGRASGAALHRVFNLDNDGRVELFRRTNKVLTVTGQQLGSAEPELVSIDALLDWAVPWAEHHRRVVANGVNGSQIYGSSIGSFGIDQIDEMVRRGAPPGANRSDMFHAIVGHFRGIGWAEEQIVEHLSQFPDGIADRYLREERLPGEVARSIAKYEAQALPQPTQVRSGNGHDTEPALELPQLFAHGDPDPRPFRPWLVKGLLPARGHGLLSGQWGTGKTFVALELAAAIGTGQPFCGHAIKRQAGTLLIAAEGADEVRLRFDAVIRAKCGAMQRAPFRWYETAPTLLHKEGKPQLIAMARQARASIEAEFELPLGLIVIDTIAACAGFTQAGDDNSNAVGAAIMNTLKALAHELGCFVFGIDHFGKDLEAGTRGGSAKESSADIVLACLGKKHLSGGVSDLRLAVRKSRGGRQGQEFPYTLQVVEALEPDEDGDPITSCVINWQPERSPEAVDPWTDARLESQRGPALRLKRILMAVLAEHGVELPIPGTDGTVSRWVDQEIVREQFYQATPVDGTPQQKGKARRQKFQRALEWAEERRLISICAIEEVTYLRLLDPHEEHEPE